ncbi:hypothetical protein Tco_0868664, partial [Tanacetum coccineum]
LTVGSAVLTLKCLIPNNETPSYEPTVSSLNNNEIDFRISFDESDDEDYTVVFDKNSFSYKIISTNDLKTDSENDNEKVNKPLFPSPEPSVSCIDDLDFFKDFENEFPAIDYNDALTSKSDFSTEPTLRPQHNDKFDLNDETSLSEYDDVEQNILYYNDLFPFNIVYPNNLKSNKGNDDNEIDMIQSSEGNENTNKLRKESHDKIRKNSYVPFGILFDHKRYYKDGDYARMLQRPRFGEAVLDLDTTRDLQFQLGRAKHRLSWRQFILALGLHTAQEMEIIEISSAGDFLGTSPSYISIRDPILRLCQRLIACSIAERSQAPEKSEALTSGGKFVARLAVHFGLLIEERLYGLTEGDARGIAEEAPVAPGGGDEDDEIPQAVPPPPKTQNERITRLEEELHGMREALWGQRVVLNSMARDFSRFTTWTVTSLTRLMDRAGVPYTRYSESSV